MKVEVKMLILIFYILLLGVVLFLPLYLYDHLRPAGAVVYFFDVGQGDSSLIITPGRQYILIDGGPDNTLAYKLGRYLPVFQRTIDLAVITHPHDDHLIGLLSVLRRYRVNSILMPKTDCQTAACRELNKIIAEKNIFVQTADRCGGMDWGSGINFEILNPCQKNFKDKNLNNYSVVGRLKIEDSFIMYMGDAENEENLSAGRIAAEIIKIGHHGSANANNCDFLRQVGPAYAVISLGAKNKFGHPHLKTLDCLNRLGTKIFRTDQNGDIVFKTEGHKLELSE